jgi:hypothetical protein
MFRSFSSTDKHRHALFLQEPAGSRTLRLRQGVSSSRKVYRSKFIPGLHDVCMLFEKQRGAS